MPPSTWIYNALAPMAINYIRRRYRRKLGSALYRYARRRLKPGRANLRGSRRRAITTGRRPIRSTKRSWSRAMGSSSAPSARTKYKKSRYSSVLGLRPGSNESKKYLTEFTNSSSVDKNLIIDHLVHVDYDAADGRGDRRQGRICDVKGVKMRHWFSLKNLVAGSNIHDTPLQVRWAVINPKENTGSALDITTTNFFMADGGSGSGNDDAMNFPSANGNCFKFMNRKINRRKFGVLQEGTFLLSNDVASNNSRVAPQSRKLLTLWIPVNKQMKWASNTAGSTLPTTNLYFVWWYCQEGDKDVGQKFGIGSPPSDTPIDHTRETVTYFKDSERFGG